MRGRVFVCQPTSRIRSGPSKQNWEYSPVIGDRLQQKAQLIVRAAAAKNLTLITAESCTGGRLATLLADAPGASNVVHGGFVTYTKECKAALGVPSDILAKHDVVSEPVARLMAEAALRRSPAQIAVSVTGTAGPTTDNDGTPVGLIYLGTSRKGSPTEVIKKDFGPMDREAIINNTLDEALELFSRMIDDYQR
jgi:nicotinamide-nucleotide amidase